MSGFIVAVWNSLSGSWRRVCSELDTLASSSSYTCTRASACARPRQRETGLKEWVAAKE
jgi:hypothetical protein